MKVMHLIDSLGFNGSAHQVRLLGPALADRHLDVEICCLGPSSPWEASLREKGLAVTTLNWTRWLDPAVLWRLRELLKRTKPDLIHVWRLPALHALAMVAPGLLSRVIMSAPLPARGRLAWYDRWLLQRVRCLAVPGVSDQASCLHQGLAQPTLRVVPPAVADLADSPSSSLENSPSIVCIGNLERDRGFRLAVWAFDIVRQIYDDARLILMGAGSHQPELIEMAQGLRSLHRIQFLGQQTDASAALIGASVVWIPSAANCGRQVALDAMARGRAVLASDVPCLRDVIIDGETGYLLPPNDVVPFARRTHQLFRDPGLAERLGRTARQQVVARCSIAETVRKWREVYASAAA